MKMSVKLKKGIFFPLTMAVTALVLIWHSPHQQVIAASDPKPELRCGWFSNPTPANAWLIDRDGEWTIGIQGGFTADGDWPDFSDKEWVETNGPHGYGCACMKVTIDHKTRHVTRIFEAYPRPLSTCRRDKSIKNKEPR
jgi:hypothetical protein